MTLVQLTKISSRGQIVVPLEVRKQMKLKEGETFAVTSSGDTMLLKRIKTPSKEEILQEFEELAKKGRSWAKKKNIKQKNLQKIIHKSRGIKE